MAHLSQGRLKFAQLGLHGRSVVPYEGRWLLFPWVGTLKMLTFALALRAYGVEAMVMGPAIEVVSGDIHGLLRTLADAPAPDGVELARMVDDRAKEKFDVFLGEDLQCLGFARTYLRSEAIPEIARSLLVGLVQGGQVVDGEWQETAPGDVSLPVRLPGSAKLIEARKDKVSDALDAVTDDGAEYG